jgi:hypothetical protein
MNKYKSNYCNISDQPGPQYISGVKGAIGTNGPRDY